MRANKETIDTYSLSEADTFIKSWEREAISYIQRVLFWERTEAQLLYHDACLIVLDQLKKGHLHSVGKGYLFKTCKNLGANAWRKLLKQRKQYDQYCIEERNEFENDIYEKYNIDLFEEEDQDQESRRALRAFSLLSKSCQQLITFKYIDEHSHQSIALASQDISSANCSKTKLSRCMKYWKRKLNELT